MSHKRKGQITATPEYARHLRPYGRRQYWSGERMAEHELIRDILRDEEKADQDELADLELYDYGYDYDEDWGDDELWLEAMLDCFPEI